MKEDKELIGIRFYNDGISLYKNIASSFRSGQLGRQSGRKVDTK